MIDLRHGDCLDVLADMPEASVDAVVTDPPYHLASISKPRPDLAGKGNPYARRQAQMASKGFTTETPAATHKPAPSSRLSWPPKRQ